MSMHRDGDGDGFQGTRDVVSVLDMNLNQEERVE